MVSCTDCVHYCCCKMWADHNTHMVDCINKLAGDAKRIDHITFPMVATNAKEMCEYYQKAKENVRP